MQKRDGDFYLAVWDDTAMFDPEAETPEIVRASQTLTLKFDEPVTAVSRALPNESAEWEPLALTGATLSLELEVGSNVTLLRISTPQKPPTAE